MTWADGWIVLLVFAAGVLLGRWIERRRQRRIAEQEAAMRAAVSRAAGDVQAAVARSLANGAVRLFHARERKGRE